MKSEQDRISRGVAAAESRLEALTASFDVVIRNAQLALDLASDLGTAYADATDPVRRALNQALFERLYIEDDRVRGELAEPFRTVCDELVAVDGGEVDREDGSGDSGAGHGRFTAALDAELRRRGRSRTNKPALCRYGAGLSDRGLVPQARVELDFEVASELR